MLSRPGIIQKSCEFFWFETGTLRSSVLRFLGGYENQSKLNQKLKFPSQSNSSDLILFHFFVKSTL